MRRTKREFVFQSPRSKKMLYPQWHDIQRAAGIAEPLYRFKDLRSTCGDKYYAEAPALGQIVLSHSSQKTTEKHYANTKQRKYEALAAVEDKISIPSAFVA